MCCQAAGVLRLVQIYSVQYIGGSGDHVCVNNVKAKSTEVVTLNHILCVHAALSEFVDVVLW